MTDATTLLALAERAEKATGPDRELDALIHAAVNGATAEWQKDRKTYAYHRDGRWISLGLVPTYTASVDAALMLVPDDARQCWATGYGTDGRAFATIAFDRSRYAATPSLALVAAALRAKGGGE